MHSGFWGFALHTLGIVKQFPKNVEQSEFGSSDITGLSEISGMFYYHIRKTLCWYYTFNVSTY